MAAFERCFDLSQTEDEFQVWIRYVRPLLADLPANVLGICEYGFTEVFNNAIDHSRGSSILVRCSRDESGILIELEDDGIGIFASLCQHFSLDSEIHAAIELVKGKMTVAPERHSGEGLFFASKVFDSFSLESGTLKLDFAEQHCAVSSITARVGTRVSMRIAEACPRQAQDVFNRYCDPDSFAFRKTRLAVALAAFEGGLVSRSQAKRVAARFEQFGEVELDFTGVEQIGQAFADELLRVWPLAHPQTRVIPMYADGRVAQMIEHVGARCDLPQPERP